MVAPSGCCLPSSLPATLRSIDLIHSHTRRQRACCCSVVVLCWSVVVGCCCHPCHHHPKDRLPHKERESTRFAWAISATPVATTSVDFGISLRLGLHVIIFPLVLPTTTWPWCDSVFSTHLCCFRESRLPLTLRKGQPEQPRKKIIWVAILSAKHLSTRALQLVSFGASHAILDSRTHSQQSSIVSPRCEQHLCWLFW